MILDPSWVLLQVSWQAEVFLGLLGLLVGSFLNVLILRLPVMMTRAWEEEMVAFSGTPKTQIEVPALNLYSPRSRCPHCLTTLAPMHLIPVMSWIWLKGQCATCREPISKRYPLIEILSAVLSVAVAAHWGVSTTAFAALLLLWALMALAFIDLDTFYLPDQLTQPLLWGGLIVNTAGIFVSFEHAFWGAVWGYVSLWVLYWAFRLVTGREGIGQGDFKLLAALGAWLGWQSLPGLLFIASLSGAGYGLLGIVWAGYSRQTPIPFGPFLALGGVVMLFFPFLARIFY